MATLVACAVMNTPSAAADPPRYNDAPPPPLPDVVLTAGDWQPQFPFPFDKLRSHITEADINAEREMCQWFPQYHQLKDQIEDLNNLVIRNNGRFDAPGVSAYADAVTVNIDKSVAFLTPRVQALTKDQDHAGDISFPLYQGESFYRLWEQLSNVSNGIKARQPTWFVGPSFQHAQRFGSKINRSHVCG
nr:hypothetical protein [Mycolicibacterium peregrinum]